MSVADRTADTVEEAVANGIALLDAHGPPGWRDRITLDLISFPANAELGGVAPEVIRNLGILYGPGLALLAVLALACFARYRLTRERFEALRRELELRRASAPR